MTTINCFPVESKNRPTVILNALSVGVLTSISLTLIALAGAPLVLAQTPVMPKPDRNGDYFGNEALIQGTVPRPYSAGSLWQVVVPGGVDCHSGVGLDYGITRQFKRGELLQADLGRGGADEVLRNAKDRNGKPWMRVRSASGENYNCYVRANNASIQPYQGKGKI
ncbi:hypothetical protein [Pseudanabaena sp. PCC 6802]|uniref:hypothetical protein n=1 Tax=Pseudanabaena sp. PCC 6802 TaxID=118173 RepID=UPI0003811E30|nr:hypothetical protein [Pseudanabaena sp. PCC 6802]